MIFIPMMCDQLLANISKVYSLSFSTEPSVNMHGLQLMN